MIDATQNQARPQAACYPGFDAAFEAVKERIDGALTGSPGLIRSYTAHLAGARGKMIRAAALLACAQGEDGGIPADAAELAAAVEMLHLATLVHDDVIDDADLRRGIPTLQRMYGRRTAVICGDYLLAASLRLAAQVGDRERYLDLRLPDYVGRICLGELGQHLNNGNLELTAYRYLKIIGGKTAALFEAAFYAGALFFTEEERLIRRYARLGRQIGMIFQLTDDCIDFESDEATAKKPVRSDYEQGVVTLPLIRAFEQDPAFLERARRGKLARAEVDERVRASGGLDDARRLSKRYYDRAAKLLGELGAPEEKRRRLTEILDRAFYGLKLQPAAKPAGDDRRRNRYETNFCDGAQPRLGGLAAGGMQLQSAEGVFPLRPAGFIRK